MTNAEEPPSIAERLNRLERIFADMGETVLAQSEVLSLHDEILSRHDEVLTRLEEQTTRNADAIDHLITITEQFANEAERDRQVFQAEIRRIWEYLLTQGGNGSNPPTNIE